MNSQLELKDLFVTNMPSSSLALSILGPLVDQEYPNQPLSHWNAGEEAQVLKKREFLLRRERELPLSSKMG